MTYAVPPFQHSIDADPPTGIVIKTQSRELGLSYSDGAYDLSFEFLRVYSPSAEVVGHGPGQEVLQTGKKAVGIRSLEPVGLYAVKPLFDDGHESGIYSWSYLRWLCEHRDALWEDYLSRLDAAGASRE
ncbi:MAG: DUF971 domain-containing protein [Betaproteobacteria bacterium]|nr:DUF971 domain-containing protein [Betaproteobacteria bacterium]NCA16760.1 DUF971 domain-containing protein [Betaproteobacteria bacterium]